MFTIKFSGMPISKGILASAVENKTHKTIEDARFELLESFRFLRSTYDATCVRLSADKETLTFDAAYAEIAEED